MKLKVTQIAVSCADERTDVLYALTEDGRVWVKGYSTEWVQMPEIETDENPRVTKKP